MEEQRDGGWQDGGTEGWRNRVTGGYRSEEGWRRREMEAGRMEEQRDRASASEAGKRGFPAEQEAGVGCHSSAQVPVAGKRFGMAALSLCREQPQHLLLSPASPQFPVDPMSHIPGR